MKCASAMLSALLLVCIASAGEPLDPLRSLRPDPLRGVKAAAKKGACPCSPVNDGCGCDQGDGCPCQAEECHCVECPSKGEPLYQWFPVGREFCLFRGRKQVGFLLRDGRYFRLTVGDGYNTWTPAEPPTAVPKEPREGVIRSSRQAPSGTCRS